MIFLEKIKFKSNKIFKAFAIIVGSFAILLYALPYFFKDSISKNINELAKDYIKSDVKFDEISLSFYSHFPNLTVSLENSVIGASANFPQENLIKAKEISLGIDLFSLFGDKITFNKLYLSEADISVKTDSLGNSNFDIFISNDESTKEDSSVNLDFDKIDINKTNLTYHDLKSKILFRALNFYYKGNVSFIENKINLEAKTTIDEVFFAFDESIYIDKKSLDAEVDSQIDLSNLRLKFNKNKFILAKFPFEVFGEIKLPNEEVDFDLQISSSGNQLENLFSLVPVAYQSWYKDTKIEGNSTIDFSLKGKMNESLNLNPDMKLSIQVSNGLINYKNGQFPLKNLNLKANINLPQLNPDNLEMNISDFNFDLNQGFAKGNLEFKAPSTIQSKIETKLDLAVLQNSIGITAFDVKGLLEINADVQGAYHQGTKKVGIRSKEKTFISSVPKTNLIAKLSNGYFKLKELPMAVEQIFVDIEIKNLDGVFENTSILVNQIKAKASDNFIDGYAKIYNLNDYQIETNLKADLNLADITSIFPVESFKIRGDLKVDFKANGAYQPKKNIFPISNSHVKLDNGYLKYTDIPELPIEDIDIEMNVSSAKGSMKDLKIEVLPISFKLAGEKFMLDADLYNFNNLTYNINSKGTLDLNKIYRVFAIEGYNVNGLIKANLNVFGKGTSSDNSTVRNRGFIDLQNIYLDSDLFPNSFIIQDGKLKFQRGKILLENVQAKYGSNSFNIGGNVSNYMNFVFNDAAVLDGNINVSAKKLNVDELMAFNTSATSTSAKKSSNNNVSGVILIPSNFNFVLDANANKVFFEGIVLDNFKGNLSINKGKVNLNETNFDLIGSKFSMSGSYQPISPIMANFDYSIKANDFDIQKAYKEITIFRELASAAKSVFGTVSLDYSLSGVLDKNMLPKMKTIKGSGVLTLEDIQFKGFKLFNTVSEKTSFESLHDAKASKVEVKTSIKNNVMTIEPTKFKIAGFRPRIQGQVTLDGKMNLGFRLGLPPFGIIGIPMTITGDSDDFKIKLGKQQDEPLDESDEEYEAYQKTLTPDIIRE